MREVADLREKVNQLPIHPILTPEQPELDYDGGHVGDGAVELMSIQSTSGGEMAQQPLDIADGDEMGK